MTDLATTDFFNDRSLVDDPFPYFEYLRGIGNIVPLHGHQAVAVLGFEEGVAIHSDNVNFSAVNSVTGPVPPIPFTPESDDITGQIAQHRAQMPFGLELLTQDPPVHTRLRSLLMRLFTPSRLRAMRPYLTELAHRLVDEASLDGRIDFMRDYASPYALYAIADLLGVPEDRSEFRRMLGATPSQIGSDAKAPLINPLEFRKARFSAYIEDRRQKPRGDILSDLANASYPDGSTPEVIDVVRAASILFGAGQDTTATLLGSCMRILGERLDLQQQLRADPSLVAAFIEEVLRLAGPVKSTFRLAKRRVTVGVVEIAPGTTVMLAPLAMNRDPRRFDDPAEFRMNRPGAKDHLAFGRGPHTCPGAALAREEVRISLEIILARLPDIQLDEEAHGPMGARRFGYVPSYAFRSLSSLQLRVGSPWQRHSFPGVRYECKQRDCP
ncbi:MAG: cytochrome P450 [Sphingomonadales bacterium]|nr:cytochrome P450 [Sphingomonadales bacterium]